MHGASTATPHRHQRGQCLICATHGTAGSAARRASPAASAAAGGGAGTVAHMEQVARSYNATQLLEYFTVTRGEFVAPCATITSRYATPATVAEVLAAAPKGTGGPNPVAATASRSAHTDPRTLTRWVLENTSGCAQGAAGNPALDAQTVAKLWADTSNPYLLANPHADPALLDEHHATNPDIVATNPAAHPDLLRACATTNRWKVLMNPACPRDLIDEALTTPSAADVWVTGNPQLTIDELLELHDHYRTSGDQWADRAAAQVSEHIRRKLIVTAPLTLQVARLRFDDVIDPLADVILAAGDAADAARALLAASFRGTIGELIEVAAGITAAA